MSLISSIIGGIGSVAGSVFGKPKTISPAKNIRSTVKGARQAGIHPLAALGASPGYQQLSSSSAGSAVGKGLEKMAATLANQKTRQEIDAVRADTRARLAQAKLFEAQSRTLLQRSANAVRSPTSNQRFAPPRPERKSNTLRWMGVPFTRDYKRHSAAAAAQDDFGEAGDWIWGVPGVVDAAGRKHPDDPNVWSKVWSVLNAPGSILSR